MTWQLTARWNPWKSRLRHSVSNRGFSKFEVYSVSHSHCHSHPHPHTRTLSNQSTLSATHSHRLLPCAFAPPVVDSSATPGALTLTATHTHTHTLSLSNQSTLTVTIKKVSPCESLFIYLFIFGFCFEWQALILASKRFNSYAFVWNYLYILVWNCN